MTTRRRCRLLTKLVITPRRCRELDEQFRVEMRNLRRRLKEPHPRESLDAFIERLFEQFEDTLARYHDLGLFSLLRKAAQRGRWPTLINEPKGRPGRPRDRNAEQVARIVSRDGRPVPEVAREVLRDHWKKDHPRRYHALMALAEDHQDHAKGYTLSPTSRRRRRAARHRTRAASIC
jgi:hypothetical protein